MNKDQVITIQAYVLLSVLASIAVIILTSVYGGLLPAGSSL